MLYNIGGYVMKAFNARKTCKQHWLFKHKQRKLGLTCKYAKGDINNIVKLYLTKKYTNEYFIIGLQEGFNFREQACKIVLNISGCYSITQLAKSYSATFVKGKKIIRIGDKEFTRKQFSEAKHGLLKIIDMNEIIKGDNNESI